VIAPSDRVKRAIWRRQGLASGERTIPEETAVSFTYDGGSYAVMMATPQDLEDFAYGFSLTEGIVGSIEDIEHLEVIEEDLGIELRISLAGPRSHLWRTPPASCRASRLRPVRDRVSRRGDADAAQSAGRGIVPARRDHEGARCACAGAGAQPRNPRRSCRCVLAAR
jgi:formate dehydrogenase assembly factor FdhD